ncbi:SIT4 phosphatase-associated protein-domain-containing protein [Echria macrotheca]|uniref:SIT4 phosphatase-associated protein-domain-containing protein n=1 Tax=Echria macrotheca TaxID=438768 RepID=A0AAJ0F9L5_9PEZI|nr:SIT4 phosphatase-associated protein-domain-containing protein [Echria macrotheca]
MKAIITVSANASQNEQTCIGPNELTRQLVSRPCVEQLIKYMLGGGNPLTCGVGIVIEVIRKNNSDYDPEGVESGTTPSSRDPIYLGTLLRLFAEHVPDFMNLIMNAPAQKERLDSTFGGKIEPLGFDRFKTCELMAELLHCSNMGLLNEVGSEEFIAARDAQRQKLRAEGRLFPARGEDAPSSVEELTMRTSASSPEAVRKLEVTNSSVDDDGFEEVTHAADEDSSHGVEELPEVPMPGPVSFLDKDEDDFVDEPLSSPRLHVREIEKEPDFDQDLVVAPLSPSKKRPEESEKQTEQTPAEKADLSLEDLSLEENKPESETAKGDKEDATPSETSDQTDVPLLTPTTSEPESQPTKPLNLETANTPATLEGMSPHPEDTPAPLFSQPPVLTSSSVDAIAKEPEATPAEAPSQPAAPAEGPPAPETSQMSIVVGVSETTTPIDDTPITPKPVVGDYLKMQFVENRVVPTILGFFFSYPWNNFLHNVVYDIVQQVFNGPMDRGFNPTLAISLFEAADITNQIIGGQQASERSQTQNKTRMGYMGHLTLIAEEVVKFTERHPPELLSDLVMERVMARDWIDYVEGALAETRERDNAILGGVRPDVAHANRAGASLAGMGLSGLGSIGLGGSSTSNALAEAGLNGGQDLSDNGASSGIGPFAISAGTLMSGFGSSSDEEEEEDNEEDINNEFRAYTDPLNANNANSMNPPSIPPPPPPPPPLNIPPSRARLQLAARLAMNKRNAAAAANGSQEGSGTAGEASTSTSFTLPSTSNERLRNPFADDEDDEERSGSGSGSDDGEAENLGEAGGSSGWHRGSWWRGMVRGSRRSNRRSIDKDTGRMERFGDGRDDSDDSDGRDDDVEEDIEDEEFGDFAMPEATAAPTSLVSGIDPAREKILLKPLPVHPSSVKTSSFSGLWPFSTQTFGSKDKDAKRDETDLDKTPTQEKAPELPLVPQDDADEVVDEEGNKINRAVEAKSRTSIEDPDDDEVIVGDEILAGRAGTR